VEAKTRAAADPVSNRLLSFKEPRDINAGSIFQKNRFGTGLTDVARRYHICPLVQPSLAQKVHFGEKKETFGRGSPTREPSPSSPITRRHAISSSTHSHRCVDACAMSLRCCAWPRGVLVTPTGRAIAATRSAHVPLCFLLVVLSL
jgi:hypothetical protein